MEKKLFYNDNTYEPESIEKGKYSLFFLVTTYIVLMFFTSNYAVPSFFIAVILIQLFLLVAPKLGFIDTPNYRSSHTVETPKCGVALFVAFVITSLFTNLQIYENYSMSVVAVLMVFLLGVYDDLKGTRARHKICIITLASLLAILDGLTIKSMGTYFSHTILVFWLSFPITILAIVGFTNSMNLIDGLDGLAATVSIVILTSLFIIGYQNDDLLIMGITSLFIPILIAFLFFNWNPASAFMGDCGSLTIGFVIAILSIKALEYVQPVVILYIVAVPVIDTIVTMVRRLKNSYPIFSPDKKHLHHILLDNFRGSVAKTVLFISFIQLVYALVGVMFLSLLPQEISVTFLICNIILWYLLLNHLNEKKDQGILGSKIA